MPDTATTYGARDHARAQAGAAAATQPTVPASSLADPPAGVAAADVVWEETIGDGGYASRSVARGTHVRLVDVSGDTCAGLLVHRADRPAERLNVADTVKLQWQAYPGPGYLLLSDMGRVLATLVEDTCACHDTFTGTSNRLDNARRYGSAPAPAGRDRFVVALAKHGLAERDVAPNLNLFTGVRIEPDGALTLRRDSRPGAHVVLRAEMDLIVTVVAVPHRLDPRAEYTAGPIRITAWRGDPASPSDPARRASPEAARAFENTDEELRAARTFAGTGGEGRA
ncbi:MAG TPA: urea amidolyase associated protein UAAP1 [Acidimicrobiales bacterium]